ncbi:MAG: transcriptional repressor LexA [Candidatus Melainabacteria bacterium]|nr:transcriptional repressor LexA [Candidatus Melainabacteria bacterium]
MKTLPPRQQDVLNAIARLSKEKHYAPSLAELAALLGVKNRMTVHQHVTALKNKNMVEWEPNLNRSLRVSELGMQHLTIAVEEEFEEIDTTFESRKGSVTSLAAAKSKGLPLVGKIAAGSPIDAINQTTDFLEIDSDYASRGCYALQVKGESMIEDGIYEGDFVIVKPNPSPNNGDIVVALLEDGGATLKRFYKEKGGFRLQPANSSMEPIFVSSQHELQIQGVVVGLFRKI